MSFNISVITIAITMSIILANCGKYAMSDCTFIQVLEPAAMWKNSACFFFVDMHFCGVDIMITQSDDL